MNVSDDDVIAVFLSVRPSVRLSLCLSVSLLSSIQTVRYRGETAGGGASAPGRSDLLSLRPTPSQITALSE